MTYPDVSDAPVRTPADYGRPDMLGTHFQPGMNEQNPPSNLGTHLGGLHLEFVIAGPVFNGMAAAAMNAMTDEIQYSVASQGLANVQMILDRSIRYPTPYYETQVTVQRAADEWVVHDRGVAYGPWLERGHPTTRFRGYHAFRRATDELRNQVARVITPIVTRWVGRIG